ncbi:hypothetical protein B5F76_01330 [Desulfovibrio sp. An276]|nr:hypothetical protein B5F76_01330 [Desulfovibrio sp. An276]
MVLFSKASEKSRFPLPSPPLGTIVPKGRETIPKTKGQVKPQKSPILPKARGHGGRNCPFANICQTRKRQVFSICFASFRQTRRGILPLCLPCPRGPPFPKRFNHFLDPKSPSY